MPKVSVIIPTYNCGSYLQQALESVFAQTYCDYEIIVVDDGSTDDTEAVVAPYLDRVTYLRQEENRGAGAARNVGIRASRGEFIAFLDADDLWHEPRKLEWQVPEFDKDPEVGLVYSDIREVFSDGTVMESLIARRPLAASGHIFENLRQLFVYADSAVVRRQALDQVGWFDESFLSLQDRELWFRLCYRWKATLVPQATATYRRRRGSRNSDLERVTLDAIRLWRGVIERFPLSGRFARIARRRRGSAYFDRGYYLRSVSRTVEARGCFLRAIRDYPLDWRPWRGLAATLLPARVRARLSSGMRDHSEAPPTGPK